MEGDHQAVPLHHIVRSSLSRLYVDRLESLTVTEDLAADDFVVGNPVLIRRVVENLLTNSMEAMEGEGDLTVETRGASGSEGMVEITVADTGVGMDASFINEKLFTPFVSTKAGGLGLGMYQTRSIVRAHGGEIHVWSEPGRGTKVTVRLPGVLSGRESKEGAS